MKLTKQRLKKFRDPYLFPFALVLAVFIAYSNVYNFEFLYDDEFLIIKNRFLSSFSFLIDIFNSSSTGGAGYLDSFYRPIQIIFYLLIEQIFGKETWAFHLLNIGLHAINAVLVYHLGRKMKLHSITSFLCALVWGLHPLHTEAVTYMSATADTLHTVFLLSGLLVAIPTFTWPRLAASFAFFILALLSKESAIVFPALLFTMMFFFAKKRFHWRTYLRSLPFWLLSLGYFVSRRTFLNFNNDMSMYKIANIYTDNILYRFFTFLATLPSYFTLIFWPHDLHIDHNFPVYAEFFILPVIIGTVIIAFAGLAGYFYHWAAWALLWFIASYVPQSGVIIPVNAIFLEHWMYLPTIGIVLSLGAGCESLKLFRKGFVGLASVAAVLLGILTFQQNWVWENPISLFSHILRYNPNVDRVRHNLAMAYSDRGDLDLALEQYNIVLKNSPNQYQTYHNMGRIYLQKGDETKAEEYFLKAISLDTKFFPSYAELANLYYKKGDLKKAEEFKKKFLELTNQ